MSKIFINILNISISASWLIVTVLLLRIILKKTPKWIHVLLWGIVAIRLVFPFSFESALSLIPSAQTLNPSILVSNPEITSGFDMVDTIVNPVIGEAVTVIGPEKTINTFKLFIQIFSNVWCVGMVIMLIYAFVSFYRLKQKVSTSIPLQKGIYQSETVNSPFVLGIFKPKIYLPFTLDEQDMSHVIAHEQAHIHRYDHWWKPLGFLLLSVHWFNPLMWVAYVLLCKDIELACDEQVIKELNHKQRANYTQALLACSVNQRMLVACPLAFGEIGVKERVKSVLNYKKPAFWVVIIGVLICVVLAVCFLSNPTQEIRNPAVQEYIPGAVGIVGDVDKNKYESISEDFSVGASKNGFAVFKDPYKAFDTMVELYADALALIQEEYNLSPISKKNYIGYKNLGWEINSGTKELQEKAHFVTLFLGIYENSFQKEPVVVNTDVSPKYYLTVGTNDVTRFEFSFANQSGGFMNADGSVFKKGDQIWLEFLDGYNSPNGLKISAYNKTGELLWSKVIAGKKKIDGTYFKDGDWYIKSKN